MTDDKIQLSFEDDGCNCYEVVVTFLEGSDKYVNCQITSDFELNEGCYIDDLLSTIDEMFWDAYQDMEDEFDLHQSNLVKSLHNR